MADFEIKKATKKSRRLKIGIQGPSGSGKTLGMLAMLMALAGEKRAVVIDTEHESASTYAARFDFDSLPLDAPYTSIRYEKAIAFAVQYGAGALGIDSISHQWEGEGGILRRKDELDRRGGNSYTNWVTFTPEHKHFIESILACPLPVVATMRSKTEYVLEANDRGKQVPRKVGTAPIQRDGVDYEFDIVFDVQLDHRALCIKDRTGRFADRMVDLCDPALAAELLEWQNSGEEDVPREVTPPAQPEEKPAPAVPGPAPKKIIGLEGEVQKITQTDKGWWFQLSGNISLFAAPTFNCDDLRVAKGKTVQVRGTEEKNRKGDTYYRLTEILHVDSDPLEVQPGDAPTLPIPTTEEAPF